MARLAAALRHKRWARRTLSGVAVAMLLGAVGVLGYPFYTNLYQGREQGRLDSQLASPEIEQAYRNRSVGEGESLTRLMIPSLDVDVIVVEGTTSSALRAGAGHYPESPLPCELGNVAIAGHRTTYGRPFHNLDLLNPGDDIILETPVGTCTYKVNKDPFVVAPTDFSVLDRTSNGTLTLTTCHPKNSAKQRLIVQADLQGPAAGA
ncbi:MAG TPA: sortase [Acidimicrobiales bacterium]|nr:sortase [Acidimicrobiales bacterium]